MTLARIVDTESAITKESLNAVSQQLDLLDEFVRDRLRKDQDYGVIPGTQKSTLLKPGAANVTAAFNCHAEPCIDQSTVDPSGNFVSYEVHVDLVHNVTGRIMARGFGNANSYEAKYRYRQGRRKCLECGEADFVRRDKNTSGWYCWRKIGGCGAAFDELIAPERVENDNALDLANTLKKMAIKRAEVDAALRLPGVARFFTQDLDMGPGESAGDAPPPEERKPKAKPKAETPAKPAASPQASGEQPKTERDLLREQFIEATGELGWDNRERAAYLTEVYKRPWPKLSIEEAASASQGVVFKLAVRQVAGDAWGETPEERDASEAAFLQNVFGKPWHELDSKERVTALEEIGRYLKGGRAPDGEEAKPEFKEGEVVEAEGTDDLF